MTSSTWRRRLPRTALALTGAAVLAVVLVGQQWRTHPDAFRDAGGTAFTRDAKPLAHADLTVAVTYPQWREHAPGRHAVLHGARARFGVGSAPAEISFWVCRGGDGVVAAADEPVRRTCPEGRRLVDGTYLDDSARGGEYLVARVRPSTLGTVRLVGVDLDYTVVRSGLDRSGSDLIPMDVRIPVR